jgi:hypothetical protein
VQGEVRIGDFIVLLFDAKANLAGYTRPLRLYVLGARGGASRALPVRVRHDRAPGADLLGDRDLRGRRAALAQSAGRSEEVIMA